MRERATRRTRGTDRRDRPPETIEPPPPSPVAHQPCPAKAATVHCAVSCGNTLLRRRSSRSSTPSPPRLTSMGTCRSTLPPVTVRHQQRDFLLRALNSFDRSSHNLSFREHNNPTNETNCSHIAGTRGNLARSIGRLVSPMSSSSSRLHHPAALNVVSK